MKKRNWRLPPGVDELLPPEAWSLEMMRRTVLDVFRVWGYEYIDPPIVEYLDALLVGASDDMDLQTLKTVDQRSGRLLGVRADMTAQAVRVDAHSRPTEEVQRLCYAGNVVFANPVSTLDRRVPLKAGAELFGATSLKADAEVIALMLEVLTSVGITDPILVLGHMGIYQSLVREMDLDAALAAQLFNAVQSKAETDIADLLDGKPGRELLISLPSLMGDREVLATARESLASAAADMSAAADITAAADVSAAIDQLEKLADLVNDQSPGVRLRFDLSELVGYGYHQGPVFSAYHADLGRALARGGRYDGIGEAFGRGRPATGFDVILNELIGSGESGGAVWVPWMGTEPEAEEACIKAIRSLRTAGEVVVAALSEDERRPERCDRVLNNRDGDWVVDPVDISQA